jgi:hypothetical protein
MEINWSKLKIGDRLIRTKGGILSKHHAIYAGYWNNQHLVAENQAGYGVRYITLDQFLTEGNLERIEHNNFNDYSQAEIINKINSKIHSSYDLLNFNCEHFVNEILNGVREGKQVKNMTILGIGVALCLLAFGISGNQNN